MGLRHIIYLPKIWANIGLLTALAKRWHSKTCSFDFLTGEKSVTLEDVYRITRIPIHDKLVLYDRERDRDSLR